MNPHDLAKKCADAMNGATQLKLPMNSAPLTLVTPKGWKRPPRFPRGELLQVNENGDRVWMFKAMNVLAWLAANGMVIVATELTP